MKHIFLFLIASNLYYTINGQGCVAIRSNGSSCTISADHARQNAWTLSFNHRYFRSYKHFSGTEEQKHRVEEGSEVINTTHSADIGVSHSLNSRWSVSLFVPVTHNVRSSKYEHEATRTNRYETGSFGLGDVRVAAYRWLLDPAKHPKTNVQAGLGLKLPTGDYQYQDLYHTSDSTTVLGPVDQSIQLGDGGTGLTFEANVFHFFTRRLSAYGNGYYLLNPREHNGVSNTRGRPASADAVRYGTHIMSVPDQFMFRTGLSYAIHSFTLSVGGRIEGVPAKDLAGSSNGFRRPGYVIAAEPVLLYNRQQTSLYLSVPFAVERNRIQSVPDKIRSAKTGVPFTGDAAFADYSINLGFSIKLK